MSDGRTTLLRFCEAHAPHRFDAVFLFAAIEEFMRRGAKGEYPLERADRIDLCSIGAAVARATGRTVAEIVPYARGDLAPARTAPAMTFCRGGVTALERDVGIQLKTALWDRYVVPLERVMGPAQYHALSETFMQALGEPLWHSFENAYWEGVGYDLVLGIRALVLMALHAFVGHVVWGDAGSSQELHVFLSALRSCIPYALSASDGQRLLVVTA